MKIGRLRKKVNIQSFLETADTFGEPVKDWTNFASNRWAEVEQTGGNESFLGQQTVDNKTVVFKLRFVKGILPKMRVVYGDENYDIQSVINEGERNRYMKLTCLRVA